MSPNRRAITIAHVIHRLQVGGLENGLVNLINNLPADQFRHIVICLNDFTEFRNRLRPDVPVYALNKREGQDPGLYFRLWRLFLSLRPDVVHTRNLAALEAQIPAWLAGVPHRVHGEHGRDIHDLDNTLRRYRWMRRAVGVLVDRFIPVSSELERYLVDEVGIPVRRVVRICNGVDAKCFCPRSRDDNAPAGFPFVSGERLVIGSLGRMEPVKDPLTLAYAFSLAVQQVPEGRNRLALAMVGDGSLLTEVRTFLKSEGLSDIVWLPGSRDDAPTLLKWYDVFVLPSLAEGISNTILEAMATGLPVVATDVGGNGELVADGMSGKLVRRGDPQAIADAITAYAADTALCRAQGDVGRARVEQDFSLDVMSRAYSQLYQELVS